MCTPEVRPLPNIVRAGGSANVRQNYNDSCYAGTSIAAQFTKNRLSEFVSTVFDSYEGAVGIATCNRVAWLV